MPPLERQDERAHKPRLGVFARLSVRNIQVFVGCTAIYIAVFLRDFIGGGFTGSPSLSLLLSGLIVLLLSGKFKLSSFDIVAVTGFFALALISTVMADSRSFSNYLVAPIIAFVISKTARQMFVTFMLCHAFASVLIQVYEYLSGTYLFAVSTAGGVVLDSDFFQGEAGVMRAKGLFQGPLSAVAFYILVSFINPRMRTIVTGMIGAILAYGRLGTVITFSLFSVRLFAKSGLLRRFNLVLFAAGVLVVGPYFITLPSFFASAFDLSSPGNAMRIYFWIENMSHYSGYPIINAAFGDLGYANRIIGATENDYLRILMDTGFLGLSLYIVFLVRVFRKAVLLRSDKVLHLALAVIAMALFPFIQSLNGAILFWIYIWGFFHGYERGQ